MNIIFKIKVALTCAILFFTNNLIAAPKSNHAIFSMGCFWCAEAAFRTKDTMEPLEGIIDVKVGYIGGITPNPTYDNHDGYKEAVRVTYDEQQISYEELLNIFFRNIDPFDQYGQFCDKGPSYTSAIYYSDDKQKALASKKLYIVHKKLGGREIYTKILPATQFYIAEDHHQNYKSKNPLRYEFFRWNCSRDRKLNEIWGKFK